MYTIKRQITKLYHNPWDSVDINNGRIYIREEEDLRLHFNSETRWQDEMVV